MSNDIDSSVSNNDILRQTQWFQLNSTSPWLRWTNMQKQFCETAEGSQHQYSRMIDMLDFFARASRVMTLAVFK